MPKSCRFTFQRFYRPTNCCPPKITLPRCIRNQTISWQAIHRFRLFRSPSPWLSFGDFFTLVVLYHLVGWLVFFADRAMRLEGQDRRRLLARLGLVHLPPAALAGLLLAWTPPGLAGLRELVFSPGVYSFFALLHVLQTAWIRVPESRGCEVRHAG
jgi:hypothetical protein